MQPVQDPMMQQQPMMMQQPGVVMQPGMVVQQQQPMMVQQQPMMMPGQQPMMMPGQQPMMMPGQQPMMVQQQPMMNQMPPAPMMDPMMMQQQQQLMVMQQQMNQMQEKTRYKTMPEKLESYEHGIFVKQKFDIMEELSGCEFPNIYYVYRLGEDGKKKGEKEFKYKEKSSCYERMGGGACKRFNLKVTNEQKVEDDETCMRCEKDCKCPYYCWNRMQMKCFWKEKGSEEKYLGKAYDNWDCCNYCFSIYDDSKTPDYQVVAACCQLYFWCQCPCKSCNHVEFFIYEGEKTSGTPIGELVKTGRDCMSNAILGDDADHFKCTFPKGSNWRQRAMLMNLTIFIDYCMFEDTSGQGRNG